MTHPQKKADSSRPLRLSLENRFSSLKHRDEPPLCDGAHINRPLEHYRQAITDRITAKYLLRVIEVRAQGTPLRQKTNQGSLILIRTPCCTSPYLFHPSSLYRFPQIQVSNKANTPKSSSIFYNRDKKH